MFDNREDSPPPMITLRTRRQEKHSVIEIEDNGPGRGARFIIRLPLPEAP